MFRVILYTFLIFIVSSVDFNSSKAGQEVDGCHNNLDLPIVLSNQVSSITGVTDHILDSTPLEDETEGFSSGIETCLDWVSTGLQANKILKAGKAGLNCFRENGKSKTERASQGLKFTKIGANALGVRTSAFKVPPVVLKFYRCDTVSNRLISGAKLLGNSAVMASSFFAMPYLASAGKVAIIGAKICNDLSCLHECETSSEKWSYRIKLAGDTATLADMFTPFSYVGTVADVLTTGNKVLKAVKFNKKLASEVIDKVYYHKSIRSKWSNQYNREFEADANEFSERIDSSYIECKYQGKSYWAKALESGYFISKGRWTLIKSENGDQTLVFSLKTPKRDILQACKYAIQQEKVKEVDGSSIQPDEIEFAAKNRFYSRSYPTAISLYIKKGIHTLKVLSVPKKTYPQTQ